MKVPPNSDLNRLPSSIYTVLIVLSNADSGHRTAHKKSSDGQSALI